MREFATGTLTGTPELVAERLAELSELGMSYAILNFAEVAYDRTALTLFTDKVAPGLSARLAEQKTLTPSSRRNRLTRPRPHDYTGRGRVARGHCRQVASPGRR